MICPIRVDHLSWLRSSSAPSWRPARYTWIKASRIAKGNAPHSGMISGGIFCCAQLPGLLVGRSYRGSELVT